MFFYCFFFLTIFFLVFHHHHHHHVLLSGRLYLILSHHPFLSFIASGRSSGLYLVYTELLYVGSSRSPREGVHRSTSLLSSSLLLQQCPAYLVCLTLIVFVTGSRWPYSCYFVWCCYQDLFNIACSILV